MADVESWFRTARDGTIIRRATVTALLVGTILTAVNHGPELLRVGIQPGHIPLIAFTYLVPFLVSLASSVSATRANEGATSADAHASPALPGMSSSLDATSLRREGGKDLEQRETPP